MLWLVLCLFIIIYHGNLDNQFYFVVIKTLEVLLVLDLILFVWGIFKNEPHFVSDRDHYFENDDIKLGFGLKRKHFLNCRYDLLISAKIEDKMEKRRISDDFFILKKARADYYEFSLAKVRLSSPFSFFFFHLKPQLKLKVKVYPAKQKCGLDILTKIEESEKLWSRGQDYSELSGFHKAVEGDDMRYLHPSLSAKKGEYIIKEGSSFFRHLYHYELKMDLNKQEVLKELGQLSYLFEQYVYPHKESLIVHAKKEYEIKEYSQLYQFFDEVYEDLI